MVFLERISTEKSYSILTVSDEPIFQLELNIDKLIDLKETSRPTIMAENKEVRMAEEDIMGKLKSQSGKERTRKSGEISVTPTCKGKGIGAVTPGDYPMSTREQQSSKKKREEQK